MDTAEAADRVARRKPRREMIMIVLLFAIRGVVFMGHSPPTSLCVYSCVVLVLGSCLCFLLLACGPWAVASGK